MPWPPINRLLAVLGGVTPPVLSEPEYWDEPPRHARYRDWSRARKPLDHLALKRARNKARRDAIARARRRKR